MSIDTDYAILRDVIQQRKPEGWAVEFGVYSGYSLGIIAEHMPVIGFDSFEGLPEDWREGFPKGTFAIPDTDDAMIDLLRGVYMGNQRMIIPGWFEDTAPTFPFPRLGLVHIDCDLYSSTVTALTAVEPYIGPGTILVFDEMHGYPGWEKHEAKAWGEFIEKHRIIYTTLAEGEQEMAFRISHIGDR